MGILNFCSGLHALKIVNLFGSGNLFTITIFLVSLAMLCRTKWLFAWVLLYMVSLIVAHATCGIGRVRGLGRRYLGVVAVDWGVSAGVFRPPAGHSVGPHRR